MRRLVVALGITAVAALLPASNLASAVEVGVGSVIDVSNEASYRAALALLSTEPAGDHTINLAGSFTISGASDPTYTNPTKSLTIRGNGFTIDGQSDRRILDSTSTGALVLEDLVAAQGRSDDDGGAIRAKGDVTVRRGLMLASFSNGSGGAIAATGDVTILDSTISGNYGGVSGGALHAESAQGATVSVTRSTLNQNFTGGDGGAIKVLGVLNTLNSTFNRNFASGRGGAVVIDSQSDGVSSIRYTTLAENRASSAHTLLAGDDSGDPSEVDISGSVVSGAPTGKCVLLENTVIFATDSYEEGDESCNFVGPGSAANASSAQLGPLQFNGGNTETVAPASTSPLVDAIPLARCLAGVREDQRGATRPQGAGCDIGAVELSHQAPPTGVNPGGDGGGGDQGTPGSGTGTAQPPLPADIPKVAPRFTG